MALTFYSCKGGCGDQQGFGHNAPGCPPPGEGWTCVRCVALRQARATTYTKRAKLSGHYGGSQIVTNPCPTCGTQMDTAICMFCSQQAMKGVGTMPVPSKASRITALDISKISKWMAGLPDPVDVVLPISGKSPLGIILDDLKPKYTTCPDHKGEYGTGCITCEFDRQNYRRSKE